MLRYAGAHRVGEVLHREDVTDEPIHAGASSPSGMKMPERKSNGRIAALTMGGAASAFGIAPVNASASAANDSAPTSERDR